MGHRTARQRQPRPRRLRRGQEGWRQGVDHSPPHGLVVQDRVHEHLAHLGFRGVDQAGVARSYDWPSWVCRMIGGARIGSLTDEDHAPPMHWRRHAMLLKWFVYRTL